MGGGEGTLFKMCYYFVSLYTFWVLIIVAQNSFQLFYFDESKWIQIFFKLDQQKKDPI